MSTKIRKMVNRLSIFLFIFIFAMNFSSAGNKTKLEVKKIAEAISKDVGFIAGTYTGTSDKSFIIFEEMHTSIAGQIEIAIMLHRLHRDYDLHSIALEGAFASDGLLSANWFHTMVNANHDTLKKQIAVQMLQEGEISSAELMAMVFSEEKVYGIEDATEYGVKISREASSAITRYLIAIAQTSLTQNQIVEINSLVRSEKMEEALEYMLNANAFTKKEYETLRDKSKIRSVEEMSETAKRIRTKATQVGAEINPEYETHLNELIRFYDTASQRTYTMIDHSISGAVKHGKNFSAIITGAAHTHEMEKVLKEKGISYVVIRPNSLANNETAGDMSYALFERKGEQLSIDTLGVGAILTDYSASANRKKPRPVIDQVWFKAKTELFMATNLIAHAAKRGERPPKNLQNTLGDFKYIDIDYESMEMSGNDVLFKATVQSNILNQPQTVWVKTAQVIDNPQAVTDIEPLLKTALETVKTQSGGGGNNIIIGGKKFTNPNPEGRKSVALIPISQDTIAAFSKTKTGVQRVRVSG